MGLSLIQACSVLNDLELLREYFSSPVLCSSHPPFRSRPWANPLKMPILSNILTPLLCLVYYFLTLIDETQVAGIEVFLLVVSFCLAMICSVFAFSFLACLAVIRLLGRLC